MYCKQKDRQNTATSIDSKKDEEIAKYIYFLMAWRQGWLTPVMNKIKRLPD